MNRSVVGVDLGGTKIRGVLIRGDGSRTAEKTILTEASNGTTHVLERIKFVIRELMEQGGPIAGIGIAAAGQIHPESQAVIYAPNLGWQNVPLRSEIADSFGLPVWVENDVRAAAWGEFKQGAGRGARSLIAVFVGTGVGSGAVLDGRLWRGASNVAGEIGHTILVPDGPPCVAGHRGCLEVYASGSGFVRRLSSAVASGESTILSEWTGGDPSTVTSAQVAKAAAHGDRFAQQLWADAVKWLGVALANYVTLLNPERLILGGGVIETVPELIEEVKKSIQADSTLMSRQFVQVGRPQLGDWAGAIGAAALLADSLAGAGPSR